MSPKLWRLTSAPLLLSALIALSSLHPSSALLSCPEGYYEFVTHDGDDWIVGDNPPPPWSDDPNDYWEVKQSNGERQVKYIGDIDSGEGVISLSISDLPKHNQST